MRDPVIGNNDDLVPALAEGLAIIFLLRGCLKILHILLILLVWAFPRIILVELDTILVNILILKATGQVVAIPLTSIVVSIIPAIRLAVIVLVA